MDGESEAAAMVGIRSLRSVSLTGLSMLVLLSTDFGLQFFGGSPFWDFGCWIWFEAYDRMDWKFLEEAMKKMGFVDQWISWNLECIKSVKFCVNLNGKLLDKFTPSRGIRRGDPLSPYLFLFVGESLSALLRQQIAARNFQELKITRKSPGISHLLFTNDSLLFFQANPDQATVINDVLRNYEKGTGQLLSPSKCSLMLGQHCPADDGNRVAEVLKVETMTMDEKYLGLPIP
nr:uncharacterized protein LOC127303821 [Lolium perenne]